VTRRIFLFDEPDRFVAGTVGQPGQRTFFLQAVQGPRVASVALEKVQVELLADRISAILDELGRRGVPGADVAQPVGDDERPLDEPLREEFRVSTLTISWDSDEAELVVEARSQNEDEADEADADEEEEDVPDDALLGPDVLRVRLAAPMALGFARRAARVVSAGRLPCPFCGQPLNPGGHICPRNNGYIN
jgi:uncharacterized repeat protein (TIGR03847 family)